MKNFSLLGVLMLAACATINIYFPAAAAEKVADEIVKDIQGNAPQKPQQKPELEPKSSLCDFQASFYTVIDQAINFIISPAQATEADLSIDSPEIIRQLTASMEKRFSALKGFYAAGVRWHKSGWLSSA